MLSAHVNMGIISHGRRSAVNHLQASPKLSPEGIFCGEDVCSEVAGWEVLHESLIGMSPFELSLPDVMVSIDKSRTDDLVFTVNDSGLRSRDIFANLDYFVSLDEDVRVHRLDVIVLIVDQDGPVLKK